MTKSVAGYGLRVTRSKVQGTMFVGLLGLRGLWNRWVTNSINLPVA